MSQHKETRIVILLAIDVIFCLLEAICGYTVHSLALVADAFHMLNDIFSLVVALWAVRVAKNREADATYTYGWQRAEILGALINAVFLLALCMTIFIEAIQRFVSPEVISNPKLILIVGVAGLVSNFTGLVLFHDHGHGGSHSHSHGISFANEESYHDEENEHGHSHSHSNSHSHSHSSNYEETEADEEADIENLLPLLPSNSIVAQELHKSHKHELNKAVAAKENQSLNMKGVFLHVLGDALGNIGVIVSALLIWKTNYSWKYYFDPAISLFITAIIFSTAMPLCRSASKILLQATPSTISAEDVQEDLLSLPGVISVHDFHIWNLTEHITIASLHAELNIQPETFAEIAVDIRTCLHAHGIQSVTVQPEFVEFSDTNKSDGSSSQNSGNGIYGAINNCSQSLKK